MLKSRSQLDFDCPTTHLNNKMDGSVCVAWCGASIDDRGQGKEPDKVSDDLVLYLQILNHDSGSRDVLNL